VASLLEAHGQAGAEGNVDALYRTYKSEVHRLASYLLGNTADAEDASQTVFLNVLRALRQGVKPADPRAWLLAITRNVCFSRHRAASSRPGEVELDPETPGRAAEDGGPSADDIVDALTRMLPNQRTALILRDFRGVPRSEISELLQLSPTGVEALLTRARTSFREELEAGRQPFDCAETKALVEQQLEGVITVAGRHSLRAHLRRCAPCSTLARASRSSRGKLASLLPWSANWISRLSSALSQAPAAVHAAGAISSTAIVASVAIPAALVHPPVTMQVATPTPPASIVAHDASPALPRVSTSRPRSHAPTGRSLSLKAAARAHGHAGQAAHGQAAHGQAAHRASSTATGSGTTTASGNQIQSPEIQSHATAPSVVIGSTRPQATGPTVSQPVAEAPATAPRSISPAARPPAKPKPRPKPARRAPKRRGKSRHSPAPTDIMPGSAPPAATLPTPEDGAVDGAGPGFSTSFSSTPATAPIAATTSSGAGSGGSDAVGSSSSNTNSGSSGGGHHKHHT
jgi:RNA polymerase sigma-70 factor, ECF subfamily